MTITTQAAVVESGGAPFTLPTSTSTSRAPTRSSSGWSPPACATPTSASPPAGCRSRCPGVLGHEGAGVVERVGSAVTSVAPGDHVLLSFTSCGGCGNCRGGHPAYCATWLPDNLIGGARRDGSATITRGGEPLGGHFFGQSSFAAPGRRRRAQRGQGRRRTRRWRRSPRSAAACRPGVGAVWNVLRARARQHGRGRWRRRRRPLRGHGGRPDPGAADRRRRPGPAPGSTWPASSAPRT